MKKYWEMIKEAMTEEVTETKPIWRGMMEGWFMGAGITIWIYIIYCKIFGYRFELVKK